MRFSSGAARIFVAALMFPACTDIAAETGMEDMISAIQGDARRTRTYTGVSQISSRVIAAMRSVRRENFVPEDAETFAYLNRPLSIGHGQTISQPFIVALMTELMDASDDQRVLEIGTGSGYQAAVLAKLVADVYTVEIIDALAAAATERLDRLGYANVHVKAGDGWYGWPEAAPFDAIIVTAVTDTVPPALVEQLAEGGHIVLPLGDPDGHQELVVVTRSADGATKIREVLPVQFVPLTGDRD